MIDHDDPFTVHKVWSRTIEEAKEEKEEEGRQAGTERTTRERA